MFVSYIDGLVEKETYLHAHLYNTMYCFLYITIFSPNTHKRHSIGHPGGEVWGVPCELIV